MSTDLFNTIYPDAANCVVPEIPADLEKYATKMALVKRYDDPEYVPVGCIDDNVLLHTKRCVLRLQSLNLRDIEGAYRMLWIHDFDELHLKKDVNTVRKVDEGINEVFRMLDIISEADNKLLQDFTKATGLKKGLPCQDALACLGKTIDFVDGPLTFFYWYTKWINAGNFWNKIVPPASVFTYTLPQNRAFLAGVSASNIDSAVKIACIDILKKQLQVIVDLWGNVSKNNVPAPMFEELEKMRSIVCLV